MARPVKVGLNYYPADTNRRNDFKIMDLLDEYGPLGYTIYDFCLQYIYENGYYLNIPIKQLRLSIIKDIGSKWIKNKDLVEQVINYCAEIGLFDKDLLQQNVMTSVGIQRRYDSVTVRNKVKKSEFWLLEKENSQEALKTEPENNVFVTETAVNVAETAVNVAEMQQSKVKKSKVNKSKVESNKSCRSALSAYGKFKNVFLSEKELSELKDQYPDDYNAKIERLSMYMESSGNTYKNHFAKLLEWLEADVLKSGDKSRNTSYDISELEQMDLLEDY